MKNQGNSDSAAQLDEQFLLCVVQGMEKAEHEHTVERGSELKVVLSPVRRKDSLPTKFVGFERWTNLDSNPSFASLLHKLEQVPSSPSSSVKCAHCFK